MARVLSLKRFAQNNDISEWTYLFSPHWYPFDFYQLEVRYLGNVVSFIQDVHEVPEYFEVVLDTRVQASRLRVADCIDQLTVSETAAEWFYNNCQPIYPICKMGWTVMDSFVYQMANKDRQGHKDKLRLHLQGRRYNAPRDLNPIDSRVRGEGFRGIFENITDFGEAAYNGFFKKGKQ